MSKPVRSKGVSGMIAGSDKSDRTLMFVSPPCSRTPHAPVRRVVDSCLASLLRKWPRCLQSRKPAADSSVGFRESTSG